MDMNISARIIITASLLAGSLAPLRAETKEAIKYIPAMVLVVLVVVFLPQVVTFLPNLFFR